MTDSGRFLGKASSNSSQTTWTRFAETLGLLKLHWVRRDSTRLAGVVDWDQLLTESESTDSLVPLRVTIYRSSWKTTRRPLCTISNTALVPSHSISSNYPSERCRLAMTQTRANKKDQTAGRQDSRRSVNNKLLRSDCTSSDRVTRSGRGYWVRWPEERRPVTNFYERRASNHPTSEMAPGPPHPVTYPRPLLG